MPLDDIKEVMLSKKVERLLPFLDQQKKVLEEEGHQPNMQPIHNIPKNLVYSGSKSNVCMTMIGGKILYRNGEFNVGEDPERIYAKCEKIVKRLLTE